MLSWERAPAIFCARSPKTKPYNVYFLSLTYVIHNKVTYFSQKHIEYIRVKFSKRANLSEGLSKFRSAISISRSENNKQSAYNAHFQHRFKSFSHLNNIKGIFETSRLSLLPNVSRRFQFRSVTFQMLPMP